MDVSNNSSLAAQMYDVFSNFLKLPVEIQSRILFLSVVTNLPKQNVKRKGVTSAISPLVKNCTIAAKALHPVIDEIFYYTIKQNYNDKYLFNIKLVLYKSIENKDKIDTVIFTNQELEHLSKEESDLLFPRILRDNNVKAFISY